MVFIGICVALIALHVILNFWVNVYNSAVLQNIENVIVLYANKLYPIVFNEKENDNEQK